MDWFTKEERAEAKSELSDVLTGVRWEDEMIEDGVCPNCAGTGYQDAEDEIWCDEAEEFVEGNECDGWGVYGCDEGEMTGASWVEILKYDRKQADRKKSLDNYNEQKAIDEIASYVKFMDDPRLCGQQVKIDYPHLGRYERTKIITAGMKKAGLI